MATPSVMLSWGHSLGLQLSSTWASPYDCWDFLRIAEFRALLADVPLAKASHMAKSRICVREQHNVTGSLYPGDPAVASFKNGTPLIPEKTLSPHPTLTSAQVT